MAIHALNVNLEIFGILKQMAAVAQTINFGMDLIA
jgi:hypothetical protein